MSKAAAVTAAVVRSPTALRSAKAARHVRGDAELGVVLDWIYVSGGLIH
jgi:hypothetical protein